MTYSNLPPGCRVSDIPGNRPEDEWGELVWDSLDGTVLTACDKDRAFELKVEDDINDYSADEDPEYVAQCVSSRHLEQAYGIVEES